MTMDIMNPTPAIDSKIRSLRLRADQLRNQASYLPEPAAIAVKRRASEVELEAWLLAMRAAETPREVLAA